MSSSANIHFYKLDMWSIPRFLDSEGLLFNSVALETARDSVESNISNLRDATISRLWLAPWVAIKTFGTIVLTRIAQIVETAFIGLWAIIKGFVWLNLPLFLTGIATLTIGTAVQAGLAFTSPLEGLYEAVRVVNSGLSKYSHRKSSNNKNEPALLFTATSNERKIPSCQTRIECNNPLHKTSSRICTLFSSMPDSQISKSALLPEGWKLIDSYGGSVALRHGNKVVIAHQGSNFDQNMKFNEQTTFFNLSEDYKESLKFSADIRAIYNQQYEITETGYSWGGLYAELNGYVFNDKVVTYDSPGSKHLLSNKKFLNLLGVKANWHAKVSLTRNGLSEDNYTSFVSAPNTVNTLGQHMGKVIRIHPAPTLQEECMKTPPYHALHQLIKCFDPETGEPFKQNEVTSWPTTKQYFSSFLKKEYWWDYLPRKVFQNKETADIAHEHFLDHMPGYAVVNNRSTYTQTT